jgi:hypothetical protein
LGYGEYFLLYFLPHRDFKLLFYHQLLWIAIGPLVSTSHYVLGPSSP